jgi:hypothetical protein
VGRCKHSWAVDVFIVDVYYKPGTTKCLWYIILYKACIEVLGVVQEAVGVRGNDIDNQYYREHVM